MLSKDRTIFVTVGTTMFEELVGAATNDAALQWMVKHGYTKLVVQYGKGRRPHILRMPTSTTGNLRLDIELYDYKASLDEDMKAADLILSHAGAGTVMECLRLEKRFVVVINTRLMHNHQTELADAMGRRKHLWVVSDPIQLQDVKVWDDFEAFRPVPKMKGDDRDFPQLLNSFLGLADKGS